MINYGINPSNAVMRIAKPKNGKSFAILQKLNANEKTTYYSVVNAFFYNNKNKPQFVTVFVHSDVDSLTKFINYLNERIKNNTITEKTFVFSNLSSLNFESNNGKIQISCNTHTPVAIMF